MLLLTLNIVVEDAKFGRAQLGCQTFTQCCYQTSITANDSWCIVLQYLAFVHAGKSRHLIFIHEIFR